MTNGRTFDKPGIYHIRVKGNLDQRWSDWFDGFGITPQAGDENPVDRRRGRPGRAARLTEQDTRSGAAPAVSQTGKSSRVSKVEGVCQMFPDELYVAESMMFRCVEERLGEGKIPRPRAPVLAPGSKGSVPVRLQVAVPTGRLMVALAAHGAVRTATVPGFPGMNGGIR